MNTKELQNRQNAINDRISYLDKTIGLPYRAVTDGIIDINLYANATLKIMWLLKEPVGDGECIWNLCDNLRAISNEGIFAKNTYARVAYSSYGLLNNISYSDMPSIKSDANEISNAFRSIAWINLSKTAAGSTSSSCDVRRKFTEWKGIVKEQISAYNPDVIILGMGDDYNWIIDELDLVDCFRGNIDGYVNAYIKDGVIYLHCFHPGAREIDDPLYINSINKAYNSMAKYI